MSKVETAPDTLTEDGTELEMVRGGAFHRTRDPVVWVDAICYGCRNCTVETVPADAGDWTEKASFAADCGVCSMLTPHNVITTLTGLNRSHERGQVQRGGGGGK